MIINGNKQSIFNNSIFQSKNNNRPNNAFNTKNLLIEDTATISKEGLDAYKNNRINLTLQHSNVLSIPAIGCRKERLKNLENEVKDNRIYIEVTPIDSPPSICKKEAMHVLGTLDNLILTKLDGKVSEPNLITKELSDAINATRTMPNATMEERAMKREAAIRLAEHIAENFLNEDETALFLKEINKHAHNDTLRDKGYIVQFDGTYRKPHINNLTGKACPLAFRQERMTAEEREIYNNAFYDFDGSSIEAINQSTSRGFMRRFDIIIKYGLMFGKEQSRWLEEKNEEFNINLEEITNRINNIKNNFDSFLLDNTFSSINSWNKNIMELLNKSNGLF